MNTLDLDTLTLARYFGGIPFELVETRAEPADGRDSSLIHFIYLGITERQR